MTMYVYPQATVPISATLAVDLTDLTQKQASSTASPTECISEDNDSSSSGSSDDNNDDDDDDDGKNPRNPAVVSAGKLSTAGLFIQTDKPLPLNPQRTVPLPICRLWKRHGETSKANVHAPDVLRKTGSGTAQFSNVESGPDQQQQQQGRELPRRTKSLDDSALVGNNRTGVVRSGRRRNAPTPTRSISVKGAPEEDATNVDSDEQFHCEDRPNRSRRSPVRRAQSEIETDDYVNYSSMNNNNLRGPFALFRGRR